jgi:hypothetical protein
VTDASADSLAREGVTLLDSMADDKGFAPRCLAVSARLFSAETAVRQIVRALNGDVADAGLDSPALEERSR